MPIDSNPKDCAEKTVAYGINWRRAVNTVNERFGFCTVVEEVRVEIFVSPGQSPEEERLSALSVAKVFFSELDVILRKNPNRVLCKRKDKEITIHFSGDGEDVASDGILGHGAMLAFLPMEVASWPCYAPPNADELAKNLSVDN